MRRRWWYGGGAARQRPEHAQQQYNRAHVLRRGVRRQPLRRSRGTTAAPLPDRSFAAVDDQLALPPSRGGGSGYNDDNNVSFDPNTSTVH